MMPGVDDNCEAKEVKDANGQQSFPAQFHYLIVFKAGEGPSHPDVNEGPEYCFSSKDRNIQNGFGYSSSFG